MKLNRGIMAIAIAIFSITSLNAQKIDTSEFGKGILNLIGKDSSFTMKIGARMQFLSVSKWQNENGSYVNPEQNFSVRRARLKFNGFAFSPKLKYKIELGLSNKDISGATEFTSNSPRYILDAVIMWNFYKNFELWAGQTKLPGNIERVISSGNLQHVDRSMLNKRFNIDRDLGIQLRHHFNISDNFLVREKIAISQGEGRNITKGNLGGYEFTARLELLPFGKFKNNGDYSGSDLKLEKKPKLMIAFTYDNNQNAVKTRGNQGTYMTNDKGFYKTNVKTLFIDGIFKYKGYSLMAEYANRNANNPIAINSDKTETGNVVQVGNALNLQTGYLLNNNWEVSARYTKIKLDKKITNKNTENQYTLGVSKFIKGHKLKVQSDVSYLSINKSNDELMFRLQFDIHF